MVIHFISSSTFVSSKPIIDESEELSPLVVTSKGGFPKSLWTTASSAQNRFLNQSERSMPEALTGMPSVMVQKTALGQSSPYIRGLTGYHNVLLVDGIRLNHSAMRSGPNQYWSTVDSFGYDRLELIRGPHGVFWGADAIGGVVNVISKNPEFIDNGINHKGKFFGRLSSAERSWTGGVGSNLSTSKWDTEISHTERSFGDLQGGDEVGKQINTGYDTRGSKLRLSRKISENSEISFGIQSVFMDNVPRTHKTIDGLSWKGLTKGKEIWRRLDQKRDLFYNRLNWNDADGWLDSGQITLSFHKHYQERNRMKGLSGSPNGGDFQFFELEDLGISSRFEMDSLWQGRFAYGAEINMEKVSSGGHKFDALGLHTLDLTQGPLAANAKYNRYAFYMENSHEIDSGWIIEPGIRFSLVNADLESFFEENDDLLTKLPSKSLDYEELIGSFRLSKLISVDHFFWGGISQGFRPPSLYDLTSTDETSAIEKPDTKLNPEKFLQAEIGWRGKWESWNWAATGYHTWINDMIVRSPIETGKSSVLKSNGDGFLMGLELEIDYEWNENWSSGLAISWMDGEVEQLLDNNLSGTIEINGRNYSSVNRATTRLMPAQAILTTRYAPKGSKWSSKFSLHAVSKADKLSLKDETDKTRIPINGTPGFLLTNFYGNYEVSEFSSVSLTIENITNIDYRIHGSGINGPGRNLILSYSIDF